MTKEGTQAIRDALKALSKVRDDLPLKARRAMGVLAAMTGYGSIETELAQEEMDSLYKSFLGLQSVEQDRGTDKVTLSADVAAALKKVITILGKLLSGYGYRPKESHYYASWKPDIHLLESAALTEAVEGKEGLDWKICLIKTGLSVNRKYYPEEVLKDAVDKFEDVKVFADHPTKTEERERPERSVRDVVGWIDNVHYGGNGNGGLYGTFHALETVKWFADLVKEAYERGKPDLLGFSIRAWGKDRIKRVDDQLVHSVERINRVMSVDSVTEPAAGGAFVELLASERNEEEIEMGMVEDLTLEELQELRPDLVEALEAKRKKEKEEEEEADAKKLTPEEYYKKYGKYPKVVKEAIEGLDEEAKGAFQACMAKKMKAGMKMADAAKECKKAAEESIEAKKKDELTPEEYFKKHGKYPKGYKQEAVVLDRPEAEVTFGKGPEGRIEGPVPAYDEETDVNVKLREADEGRKELESKLEALTERLDTQAKLASSAVVLEAKLAEVKLPTPTKAVLRSQFEGKVFEESALQEAVDVQSRYLSDLEGTFLPDGPVARVISAEADKVQLAVDGMVAGEDQVDPKTGEKVPAFRSLMEAYCVVAGKSPWQVRPEEILMESKRPYDSGLTYLREAVETANWNTILGDSITRRLLKEYALPFLDEWKLIVSDITSIKDFRTQRRERMGGYQLLPIVGEGSTYPDLVSPTDEEIFYTPHKRGGLENITLEAIANDDLNAVRRIPIKLARGAKRTLYEFVFNFLLTNALCTYDGVALSAVAHANFAVTALSWATVSAAKTQMRVQTEYQTGQVLGLAPKYLVVPAALWSMAQRVRDSDYEFLAAVAAIGAINIHKGSFDIIVVPYWDATDANNWWMVADPAMSPTLEIGFFQGRQEPELFTEREGAGDHFTADKVVYKIRHIYGGHILDHRTFVGHIVP